MKKCFFSPPKKSDLDKSMDSYMYISTCNKDSVSNKHTVTSGVRSHAPPVTF